MRDYELVVIVSPEVTEENVGGVNDRIGQWIAGGAGEVTNVNVWGRRRLAYPIRDFREGNLRRHPVPDRAAGNRRARAEPQAF